MQDDAVRLSVPVTARDHAQGPDDAPLTLVEYGDYECPHCGHAHPIVQEVQRRFGDALRFVFRNFPLSEIHPHAALAAEAAEAAAEQGHFWPMHDLLLENQRALGEPSLIGYAAAIGLDEERVRRELEARSHRTRVRSDFAGGVRSGVNGTPTFFINGIRYDGDWDAGALTVALRASLMGQLKSA